MAAPLVPPLTSLFSECAPDAERNTASRSDGPDTGREPEDGTASARTQTAAPAENALHIQKAIMVSYPKDNQRDDE